MSVKDGWGWKSRLVFAIVVTIILSFMAGNLLVICKIFGGNLANSGQFGDSYGSVNALFSGLAFAGVVWALILQHHEREDQRKSDEKMKELQRRIARAQLKQARLLFASAQLNACGLAISTDQKTIDAQKEDNTLTATDLYEIRQRLDENIIRLMLILYNFRPEMRYKWKPYIQHISHGHIKILKSILISVERQLERCSGGPKPSFLEIDDTIKNHVLKFFENANTLILSAGEHDLSESINKIMQPIAKEALESHKNNKMLDEESLRLAIKCLSDLTDFLSR